MKKSVFLMILITVLAWGATLWLDPPAPNMRGLMHEVYYLDGLLAWEAFAGAILLMTQPRLGRASPRSVSGIRRSASPRSSSPSSTGAPA